MTQADRIIDCLDRNSYGLTDTEIAVLLDLPKASVRRTRSLLEKRHRVFFLDCAGPRMSARFSTREPTLTTEEYMTAAAAGTL
jgi:hypothetical protein